MCYDCKLELSIYELIQSYMPNLHLLPVFTVTSLFYQHTVSARAAKSPVRPDGKRRCYGARCYTQVQEKIRHHHALQANSQERILRSDWILDCVDQS